MKTDLYNQSGEVVGSVDLPDSVFDVKTKTDLMHQVLVAQAANSRHPYAHSKDRSEVRGGGRKPWRQKGTGRARHGSRRSPIWIGGGVAFGPRKERNFSQKINKKERRAVLFMALSSKVRDKELMVLDALKFEESKTKMAASVIKVLSGKFDGYKEKKNKRDSVLLITPGVNKEVVRAVGNLSYTQVLSADSLNVKDVLEKKYTILLKDALPVIEKTYKP
ncbi:MAG: 50S ribosomal protein L4 [Candidatus Yanofskybacteria bacterium]|nr:50S ribosomal protein L4 [Candidatus Yanofskybacteria bacterium]